MSVDSSVSVFIHELINNGSVKIDTYMDTYTMFYRTCTISPSSTRYILSTLRKSIDTSILRRTRNVYLWDVSVQRIEYSDITVLCHMDSIIYKPYRSSIRIDKAKVLRYVTKVLQYQIRNHYISKESINDAIMSIV